MFILRRITSESIEGNTCLNEDYILVLKERNEDDFNKTAVAANCGDPETLKEIYGFISYNSGSKIIPLYEKSQYFIMTGEGKTFANISKKLKP